VSRKLLFERLRRGLVPRGVVLASGLPPGVEGRPDDYRLAVSRVVEGDSLAIRDVGRPEVCPEPLAFLDGVQSVETLCYVSTMPLVAAVIAAAVRLRTNGRLQTVARAERRLLVGREEVLAAAGIRDSAFELLVLPNDERCHPLKELELAHRAVDAARAGLERRVGERFRAEHGGWLVLDGVLPDTEPWVTDPRAIGVSKSHATLPFSGPELDRYLNTPAGSRTTVFEPATGRATPVHSWGLRLWPFEGRDLLHGLVRIEVAARPDTVERVDEMSRWILAERVPLSRPDPRWDRLLYGVSTVERHLRAR